MQWLSRVLSKGCLIVLIRKASTFNIRNGGCIESYVNTNQYTFYNVHYGCAFILYDTVAIQNLCHKQPLPPPSCLQCHQMGQLPSSS